MKNIWILLLAGCTAAGPDLIVTKPTVFIPDATLFNCPTVEQFPDTSTLTDADVAELLITLDSYNHICAESLIAVRQQLLAAKQQLETAS